MTIKEQLLELVKSLPKNADIDDIRYKLMVVESVNRGLSEIKSGKGISHERANEILNKKWNMK
jgi:hypothetical protein